MISLYYYDILKKFRIMPNQVNLIALKGITKAMIMKKIAIRENQKLVFNEEQFLDLWKFYEYFYSNYFDINYNRNEDISSFFTYIINSYYNYQSINFIALFCPGYTQKGYKNYLGHTTIWKLEKLKEIESFLHNSNIKNNILCYYSDVFLENTDFDLNPHWEKEMLFNCYLFNNEGLKHFDDCQIKKLSELELFSDKINIEGYIDRDIIKNLSPRLYNNFIICNQKFYQKLGFTCEQMQYRNERLITMYKLFSGYINSLDNGVFLPMENMYERENIFSENHTCTMYLKLKK